MTAHNAPVAQTAACPETKDARRLDPLTAETLARYARQEMMAKFVAAAWTSVTQKIARWYRNRVVYQDLSELPDHLLSDIGVRRDQVSAIAFGGLTRPATDLERAAGQGSLSFFEHKPAAAAVAAPANESVAGKPLAA